MTRNSLATVVVAVLTFAASTHAADPVTLSVDAISWEMHEETGRVFATVQGQNRVIEYSSDGSEVRSFDVGGNPTELIFKRDQLIVACTKTPTIYVVDVSKNKVVASIALMGSGPFGLFCSQEDNPYVYAICNTGSSWWDAEVFQVDIEAAETRNRVKVKSWGQSHPIHVAMSRDGKWIVPDSRGRTSPSGADLMKVDEEQCTFTQVRDYHSSFGQIVAGPRNRFWMFGNMLYSGDITEKIKTFIGSPAAIHPKWDLVASLGKNKLCLERFSDSADIGFVPLNVVPKKDSDTTIRFDLKEDRIFVGTNKLATWVDLDAFREKLEPVKVLRLPSSIDVLADQPLRIPVDVTNADVEPKIQVAIADGPQGASIDGGELTWAPTANDVGIQTIQLEARRAGGKVVDSAKLTVQVKLKALDLGFRARSMELSASGKHLIAWGPSQPTEGRSLSPNGPDELVVIDVEKLEISARKVFSQGIRCATVDDRWVYLSPNSGNLFYRINHRLDSDERQFLKSAPTQLLKVAPDALAVIGRQFEFFDVDPLQSLSVPSVAKQNPNVQTPVLAIDRNTIQMGNRIVDYASGDLLRCLTSTLPNLAETPTHRQPHRTNQNVKRWGRLINGNTLTNHTGSRISQWSNPRFVSISQRWPAVILVRTTSNNAYRMTETRLELSNLIDGTVDHAARIAFGPAQSGVNYYGQRNQIIVDTNRVLVLEGNELIVAPIPESIVGKMPSPTYFTERQPTEFTIGGSKTLQLGVGGPKQGVTFSLMAEYEGIVMDASSGELTIDSDRLWEAFLVKSLENMYRFRSSRSGNPFDAPVNAAEYKYLTGKSLPADQFAAQLPVSVVLRDSEGQEDATQFSLIALGPRKQLDARIEQRKKQQEKERAEALARQEEARRLAQQQMKQKAEGLDSERLDRLEARIRRIEAALDSILKKLEDQ